MAIKETILGEVARWVARSAVSTWWQQLNRRPILYPDRAVLDRESPLAEKIRATETIYAIWFTGTKAIAEIPEVVRVERLLLTNPNSRSLKYYQVAMDEDRNIGKEIQDTTRRAIAKGIEVRWLHEFLGYTLMIGNPRGSNPWAQLEIAFPIVHGGTHPTLEFRDSKHKETISKMIEVFDSLWGNEIFSKLPDMAGAGSVGKRSSRPKDSRVCGDH